MALNGNSKPKSTVYVHYHLMNCGTDKHGKRESIKIKNEILVSIMKCNEIHFHGLY